MEEIVKETVVTQGRSNSYTPVYKDVVHEATTTQFLEYIVYFLLGIIEILLGFRFLLKLMGASLQSSFVAAIYGFSGVLIAPFQGIFRNGFTQGVETTSVFEPSIIVAVIVYGVFAWGLVKLIRLSSGEKQID